MTAVISVTHAATTMRYFEGLPETAAQRRGGRCSTTDSASCRCRSIASASRASRIHDLFHHQRLLWILTAGVIIFREHQLGRVKAFDHRVGKFELAVAVDSSYARITGTSPPEGREHLVQHLHLQLVHISTAGAHVVLRGHWVRRKAIAA